ncbi:MAG TPA: radical SAM protein [Tenuifilaceae bacterium]|nr:radical SAM protein [Tenuifilaceae bacterium]HPJ45429.1 radical SAM protein [Tenuifilaceae bacterium]HPQ33189.1 radical SAM protein [Tenuifilaceae bacterium]
MIAFGPIPSRRLGRSLGINNIPLRKICSYSCIYCQVGPKQKFSIIREPFYEPWVIQKDVENLLSKISEADKPDYLTFVSNGEPTLDIKLGKSIRLLKSFNIPIAVITNASLLSNAAVRDDLMQADWVSVKVDTAEEHIWRKINRPHPRLYFSLVLDSIIKFSKEYMGTLVTETMLADGVNDSSENLQLTADYILRVNPSIAYISVPTRPPALSSVKPSNSEAVNRAYQIFLNRGLNAELILGFEGTDTGYTGNAENDILNICSVHPLREDTIQELLAKDHADFSLVEKLISEEKIKQLVYESNRYYLRKHLY